MLHVTIPVCSNNLYYSVISKIKIVYSVYVVLSQEITGVVAVLDMFGFVYNDVIQDWAGFVAQPLAFVFRCQRFCMLLL